MRKQMKAEATKQYQVAVVADSQVAQKYEKMMKFFAGEHGCGRRPPGTRPRRDKAAACATSSRRAGKSSALFEV